jgi:cytochrome P450
MTEFLLGESVDTLMGNSSLDHQAFLDSFTAAAQGVGKRILLGKLKFLFPDKKFKEACHSIFKFIDSRIDQTFDYLKTQELAKKTSSEEKEPLVFIRELAKQTKDRGLIAAQVLNVLNAANDGAAIVISHIIFFLSRYPEVQKKLREEISVIGDKKPDYEQLRNMKYLRYIINESQYLFHLQ